MAAAKPRPGDLDGVIGRNVRRVRLERGASQDDLAQALRDAGWGAATDQVLMSVEKGNRSLRFHEVLLLADVLNVPVAALLEVPDGWVRLGSRVPESGRDLVRRLTEKPHKYGERSSAWSDLEQARRDAQFSAGARHSFGDESKREAERHAANRLGLAPDEIVRRSYDLWGRTLSDERDGRYGARAPTDASSRQRATLRGHITRELLDELRGVIGREAEERILGGATEVMDALEDSLERKGKVHASEEEGEQ